MNTNPNATPYRRGRRTLYKGVMMRSRTEARFAAMLDLVGLKWDYEPFCLADEHGQWLPDFEVYIDSRRTLVDVKGTVEEARAGLPRWTRIAKAAIPDTPLRVLGAGYSDPLFHYEGLPQTEAIEYRPNGWFAHVDNFQRYYFNRDLFWSEPTDELVDRTFTPSAWPASARLPVAAVVEARLALPPAR